MLFFEEIKLKEHIETTDREPQGEIILVRLRRLAWPAMIMTREDDILEVKMISDDSLKIITADDTEPFNVEKISNTKNSKLKNAYAKAIDIMKK